MRSKDGLARASVHISKTRDNEMLCDALSRCPTLKHLDISLTTEIDDCTLLKSIPSFVGLRILVVSASFVLQFDRVIKLLGSCKKLTRGEFYHVDGSISDAVWTDNVSGIRSLAINAVMDTTLYVPPETLVSSILSPEGTQTDSIGQTFRENPRGRKPSLFQLAI